MAEVVMSIREGLQKAREMELTTGQTLDCGKFRVVPTIPTGRSFWAGLVREGQIEPWDVLWALREKEGRTEWLGILLANPVTMEGDLVFDLRTTDGRKGADRVQARYQDNAPSFLAELESQSTKKVRLTTGRLGGLQVPSDAVMIDITVKSGVPAFAPTWQMVKGVKGGWMTQEEYVQDYRRMMSLSQSQNKAVWDSVLKIALTGKQVVLACYCRNGSFCHRYLLAEIFAEWAYNQGVVVEITKEEDR